MMRLSPSVCHVCGESEAAHATEYQTHEFIPNGVEFFWSDEERRVAREAYEAQRASQQAHQ